MRNVLSDFRREAEALGAERTLAVATSAVRDAENGEAFLGEVEWSYGFATRLLSGDEEAALTRARRRTRRRPARSCSTSAAARPSSSPASRARASTSARFALTERHLHSDPPTGEELAAAAAAVASLLPPLDVRAAVGVAGTVGQLAVLLGEGTLRLGQIEELLERLAAMTLAERRALPGLDPAGRP